MSQKIAFYYADKYEFQYADLAASSKNSLRPSEISYILESDEFVKKNWDSDGSERQTQMKAVILIHIRYTLQMCYYYNSPALAKFLNVLHSLCGHHQHKQESNEIDRSELQKDKIIAPHSAPVWII